MGKKLYTILLFYICCNRYITNISTKETFFEKQWEKIVPYKNIKYINIDYTNDNTALNSIEKNTNIIKYITILIGFLLLIPKMFNDEQKYHIMLKFIILVVIMILIGLQLFQSVFAPSVFYKIKYDLIIEFLKKILNNNYLEYRNIDSNMMAIKLKSLAENIIKFINLKNLLWSSGIGLIACYIKLLMNNPILTLSYFIGVSFVGIYGYYIVYKNYVKYSNEQKEAFYKRENLYNQTINNLLINKIYNIEDKILQWNKKKNQKLQYYSGKSFANVAEFISIFTILNFIYIGLYWYFSKETKQLKNVGIFALSIGLICLIMKDLMDYAHTKSQIKKYFYWLKLDKSSPKKINNVTFTNNFKIINCFKSINNNYILKNINFDSININKKEEKGPLIIGLLGSSGSGKSTFLQCLRGINNTDAPSIFFEVIDENNHKNYVNINNLDDGIINRYITYIPQDGFFYETSLWKNITFNENYSMDLVINILKQLNLYDLILTKPEGLQYKINDQGTNISGGQRNRIKYARLMVRNTPFYILDELEAGLDEANSQKIMDFIKNNSDCKVCILATHNLDIAKQCDHLLVFEKGQIIKSGKPEIVLNENNDEKIMTNKNI